MADDLQKQKEELEKLRKEYEKLTKKPAPLFNTNDLRSAQAAVRAMSDALEEAKDRASQLSEGFKGIYDLNVAILGELKKGYDATSLATKAQSKLLDISQKLKYDQQGLADLSRKQLLTLQAKQKIAEQDFREQAERLAKEKIGLDYANRFNVATIEKLKLEDKISDQEEAILRAATEAYQNNLDTNFLLEKRIKQEERIEELMGLGGVVLKGIEQTLSKIGLGDLASSLGLDSALEKMRELSKEIEEASGATLSFADKIKVLRTGFTEIKDNVRESLTDPLSIGIFLATQITDAFLSVDKSTGELAKNFGISYDAAAGLSNELNTAANASYLLNITTQGLTESFITLNNQFGTFAQISEEALTTFTRLTKEAGLSAESAGMLFRTTILTGKEVEATTQEFLGEASALAATNGIALNQKQILEEVKNTSQATLLSLGGQPAKIAEAIVQAKLLGVNLQQVEGIASSLLEFESSISSELEAELLTGKNLNLERARLAAINNDLATVAEEIAKQVGTAAEFTQMNVIQQEALAKSVGMTREDLAKSLIEREALVKLSGVEGKTAQERFNNLVKEVGLEEAKKQLGDETLANQLAGQSIQERFTASIEKLKEVFVSLAEPLIPVLNIFAQIAEIIAPIAGYIGQIVKWTAQLGKYLIPIYGLYKGIQVVQLAGLAVNRANYALKALQMGQEAFITREKGVQGIMDKQSFLVRVAYNAQLLAGLLREQGIVGIKTFALSLDEKSLRRKIILRGYELGELAVARLKLLFGKQELTTEIATQAVKKAGLRKSIGEAVMKAYSSAAAVPVIGWVLGGIAAAAAAAIGYKFLQGNDVVSQGYGKRTLMAPEGAIQLNDKDTVIAGTDLGGGTQQSSGGGSVNMAPLVAELQAIKTLLNTVLTKEGTISINGTTVATAIYPDIQRMSRLKDFKTQ